MTKSIISVIYVLAISFVISSCSGQRSTLSMEQKTQKEAATRSYINCVGLYASILDDNKSDAMTIAKAVASNCAHEYRRTLYDFSTKTTNRSRHYFYEKHDDSDRRYELPLKAVLHERDKKR